MNKHSLTIVKFGGSVITYKDRREDPAFRKQAVVRLAREFSRYVRSCGDEKFILVHGAGSFGHPLAKKYNIGHGGKGKKNIWGSSQTHASVQKLNFLFTNIFLQKGCSVFSFSPSSLIVQRKGRISSFSDKPLQKALGQGLIPVLYGDVALDEILGTSICSGDQIISYLSNRYFPQRVFFLSDVEGIYTSDPWSNPDTKLLKEIQKRELRAMIDQFKGDESRIDVTDSMKGKLQEILRIPCPVSVFNGLRKGSFLRALRGQTIGTKIINSS